LSYASGTGSKNIDTLKSRLDALCASRREIAVWNAAYEEMVAILNRRGFVEHVLAEGEPFPDFVLPSAEGRLVSLASLLERGPVIISFFRGEWCPFCRLMLAALTEALPEIEAAGASLVALTPETGGLPLTMKQYHGARFEVLSDVDYGVGLSASVIFKIPKLYRARLEASKLNFVERHGNAAWFLPIPATFILTQNGVVAWRFVDADFSHRAEPADIIDAVRTLTEHA
jgi:peroxiredoxin